MSFKPDDRRYVRSRRHLLGGCLLAGSILAAARSPLRTGATARIARAQVAASPPLLVDVSWLSLRLTETGRPFVVLDLGDPREYRRGHLPGAVHGYWLETVERDYPFYGTVLNQLDESGTAENQGKRLAWMRRYGIGPETDVIAYDHGDGRRAARIVWFLHFLGHAGASMLDGGYGAWRQAGQPVTDEDFESPALSVEPVVSPQSGFYLSTSELQAALADPNTLLVDIRTDEERNDTIDGQFSRGVIPNSIRAPWRDFLRQDGNGLVDVATSVTLLEDAGIDPARSVVLYGRFGCDTNVMWLVLKRAGYPAVEVYDRGWIEWSATSGLPAEPLP